MPEDAERTPIIEFLRDERARGTRHGTERVAAKINQRPAVRVLRQLEALAKTRQNIRRIEVPCALECCFEGHASVPASGGRRLHDRAAVTAGAPLGA